MSANITPFSFEGFAVRTIQIDGEPWFVAADVCDSLTVATEQTRRLDEDEKGLRTVQTLGGPQDMLIINESGLYSLILTSRKPKAKRFKKWVTSEVLPSIRKTGSYSVQAPAALPNYAEALRQLADKLEENQALAIERDHAIATKAQIGSKREATAMATAASARRETTKLRALMGEAAGSASILAVQGKLKNRAFDWRLLKSYCKTCELEMGNSWNPGIQRDVKTYPAEAWMVVYDVDLIELFGEVAA